MKKNKLVKKDSKARLSDYDGMVDEVIKLIEHARHFSVRAVNATMTATYWLIGRHIFEYEQQGKDRADYGGRLLKRLADDLTGRYGRGFSHTNLKQFRQFYLAYPDDQKGQTVSGQLAPYAKGKGQTRSDQSPVRQVSDCFPLPWSAYVRLLSVKDENARKFYEVEAVRGGWSVRQIDRQIDSMFYERTALSRNKAAMLAKGSTAKQSDAVLPEEEIKDPYVLEFLGLRDEYSESELEDALTHHIEHFLMELGGDFTFIGRQRRLRIGDEWYRIDLLFFHRRLKCLVVIDLKTGKFTHADVGQMHMYLNYAHQHWTLPDENPPVGLILCAWKDEAVAKYSLEGLPNKIMAAEYRMALPDEKLIADELAKTRKMLDGRQR